MATWHGVLGPQRAAPFTPRREQQGGVRLGSETSQSFAVALTTNSKLVTHSSVLPEVLGLRHPRVRHWHLVRALPPHHNMAGLTRQAKQTC